VKPLPPDSSKVQVFWQKPAVQLSLPVEGREWACMSQIESLYKECRDDGLKTRDRETKEKRKEKRRKREREKERKRARKKEREGERERVKKRRRERKSEKEKERKKERKRE
jgi:hypothetical protein